MRIALVHYHLLRGGVTSVVRHQAKALIEAGEDVLLLAGGVGEEKGSCPVAVIDALSYDSRRDGSGGPLTPPSGRAAATEALASAMTDAMVRHWGAPADVVHVHNPLIRKNTLLLGALRLLQERGLRLLLQNHDFAEDFRPDVYVGDEPYPEHCHYGAINSRDYSFLHRSGLDSAGVHLLPNAVVPIRAAEGLERTRYLYPVRAIRRKNLGEALLLSLFIPPGRTVAVTLPPTSHRDEPMYRHWVETAARLSLPVEFEVGTNAALPDLLGSSVCALTTSVKEGFGFSFLEPWTAGRAVIGRRIDYVCRDFERSGVRFDDLYSSLDVPLVYLPPPILRKKLEKALSSAFQAFSLTVPSYALKALTDDTFSRDCFDFGRLDEELQTDILETVVSNDAARQDLVDANPFLARLGGWAPDEAAVEANRRRVLSSYDVAATARTLISAYTDVLEKPVKHRLSKAILLELFLDPLKLSLIGVGHD